MAKHHTQLIYAVPLLLLLTLATGTEAVARLQVNTTAAAQATTINQALAQALTKLLHPNGTHVNVTVKPPFAFNATIRTDTIKMAGQLLQQLAQAQPLLAVLQSLPGATTGRALLLADDGISNISDTSSVQTMTATTTSTPNTTTGANNGRKVAAKINVVMSDAWLVTYSGFKVAQVVFQLLGALLKAGATGTVTLDTSLILLFADAATNFMSTVSYLLYGTQKLTGDSVAPLG